MLVVLAPTRNARANMMTRLASTFPAPLRPDMLALAQNLPAPPVFDPTRAPAKETGKKIGSGSGLTGDKKIPKWLKLPGASMSRCASQAIQINTNRRGRAVMFIFLRALI